MNHWVKVRDQYGEIYYYNKHLKKTVKDFPSEKKSFREKKTLADFVNKPYNPKPLEKPMPRIDKLATYLYDKYINSKLNLKSKTLMDLALSKDPRSITEEEIENVRKSDYDIWEDEQREKRTYDDEYDEEYNPDFPINWDEEDDDEDENYQSVKARKRR